jgi:hypothetical protein
MMRFKFLRRAGALCQLVEHKKFATLSGAANYAQRIANESGEVVWCHWNGRTHRAEPVLEQVLAAMVDGPKSDWSLK